LIDIEVGTTGSGNVPYVSEQFQDCIVREPDYTIDFLLTRKRNKVAAHKFLMKAIHNNDKPLTINIDYRGANKEALSTYNKRTLSKIKIRQCKYPNNRVEAYHRSVKLQTRNMPGFKSFESASRTLTGIKIVRMIKRKQVTVPIATAYATFSLISCINYSLLTPYLYISIDATEPNSGSLASTGFVTIW
jgi:hypothetical protein